MSRALAHRERGVLRTGQTGVDPRPRPQGEGALDAARTLAWSHRGSERIAGREATRLVLRWDRLAAANQVEDARSGTAGWSQAVLPWRQYQRGASGDLRASRPGGRAAAPDRLGRHALRRCRRQVGGAARRLQ